MWSEALLLLVVLCGVAKPENRHHHHLTAAWSTLFNHVRECPSCTDQRSKSDNELTALRIENIKKQILKKLRLKEPPVLTIPRSALPQPLASGTVLHKGSELLRGNKDVDDFYGKTDQVILFPQQDRGRCVPENNDPAACFQFQLPTELEADDVTTAELWVYKVRDRLDNHNQTLVISEVAHWDVNRSLQKTKPLAIEMTAVKEGWLKIDLLWAIKLWLEYSDLDHVIHVACKTCAMDVTDSPVSLQPTHQPFLVINTHSISKIRRPKRNIQCAPGIDECCREDLYVSFADIGWDDWIIQPAGYESHYCKGSCSNAASLTQSGSYYTTIMQRVLHQSSQENKKMELVPCCTATRMSSITLLYMDNYERITQKTLPNMVVDTCGCQ